MTTWFRLVPHPLVHKMQTRGWVIANPLQNNRRGKHVVVMQWEGFGEPE